MIRTKNTMYSYYRLELTSGNLKTSALLKFTKRSGEITHPDRIIDNTASVALTSTPIRYVKIKSYEITVRLDALNKPFKIKFDAQPPINSVQVTFGLYEQAILIFDKTGINIFVYKNPATLDSCFSYPEYMHNYWPCGDSDVPDQFIPV